MFKASVGGCLGPIQCPGCLQDQALGWTTVEQYKYCRQKINAKIFLEISHIKIYQEK